jgi:hypothetical protein
MADFTTNENLVPSIENQTPASTQAPASNSGMENAKNAVVNNTAAAANAVKNHPLTQSVANGPVAEGVKNESAKTSNEFSNLAASRTTPSTSAATGQPLTHYHSFFTTLLSWNNPRASGIAYVSIVLFIFAALYLNILRYALKLTWMTLGVTVLAEVVGQYVLSTGLTSQFRPKKYYTLSKETLNSLVGDVHELINFFVIETQRVVFAENVLVSAAAFVAAFFAFLLIGLVPFWGLSLIATSVIFLTPLIYKTNKELIDAQLNNAANIANRQSEQVRRLASQSAARASETTKQYVGDYSSKAQEMIGSARRSVSPTANTKVAKSDPIKSEPLGVKQPNVPTTSLKQEDFPIAPSQEFKAPPVGQTVNDLRREDEPLIVT